MLSKVRFDALMCLSGNPVKENPICWQSSNMEATFLVLIIWSEIHSRCQCLLKFNSLAPAVYWCSSSFSFFSGLNTNSPLHSLYIITNLAHWLLAHQFLCYLLWKVSPLPCGLRYSSEGGSWTLLMFFLSICVGRRCRLRSAKTWIRIWKFRVECRLVDLLCCQWERLLEVEQVEQSKCVWCLLNM